jgi:hypothetical protein
MIMKNSKSNTEVAPTTNKAKAQSVAVSAVKAITYPIVIACDLTSTVVNFTQAKAIQAIDGTPAEKSMENCINYSQNVKMKIMLKAHALTEKIEKQRESNRQQDIDKLEKAAAKLKQEPVAEPTFIPINQRKKLSHLDEPADILATPMMSPVLL